MELSTEEKLNDRRYPGVRNMKGLGLEIGFYCTGCLAMSYKVYQAMKANKNPLYASTLGMLALGMLNYKTEMAVDLVQHYQKYPELYEEGELSFLVEKDKS